jgi:hypothetical protein
MASNRTSKARIGGVPKNVVNKVARMQRAAAKAAGEVDFIASQDLVKLRLPDAGGRVGVVYLRPLMAADALALAESNGAEGTPNHPHQFMAICVVDKNGNRIFKDHDQIRSMRLDHYNQILGALLPIINPSAAEVLMGKATAPSGSDSPTA